MEPIGFWARLWLAIALPWRVLFDRGFATRVEVARRTAALPPESAASRGELAATEPTTTHAEPEPDHTAALLLLAILQREGRLIDFLQEDVAAFSDADVGAAARVVHEGCKRGLADYVEIEPVRSAESEGAAVTLAPGFDAESTRVTGNVVGEPPYSGTLAHHGWRVKKIRLPELTGGHDPRIVAPAEVEVS